MSTERGRELAPAPAVPRNAPLPEKLDPWIVWQITRDHPELGYQLARQLNEQEAAEELQKLIEKRDREYPQPEPGRYVTPAK
jgi:hypothetical protein